jgi:integrating conjugative element protein (TIGR03757 family)
MKRIRPGLWIVLALSGLMVALAIAAPAVHEKPSAFPVSSAESPLVVYLGTNQYPLGNAQRAVRYGVRLVQYNLDGHRNLERRLSADLPPNLEAAERIVNERLAALDGEELQNAFRGIALAIQWDIRKAPAFVFDNGQTVIYGLTDVEVALKRWQYDRARR